MTRTAPLLFILGMLVGLAAFAAGLVGQAYASTTGLAKGGVFVLNGQKTFPLMVSTGPSDVAGMRRLVSEGVRVFKFQPSCRGLARGTHTAPSGHVFSYCRPWSLPATLAAAKAFDAQVYAAGGVSEVNLCSYCGDPRYGNIGGANLAAVSAALSHDPGFGIYKGADEPWWNKISAGSLLAPFRATRSSDPRHLWTEFQADMGTTSDFRPYGLTTNIGGVVVFPVRSAAPMGVSGSIRKNAPLSEVGRQTAAIKAATPSHAVWTGLQLCDAGSKKASLASGLHYSYKLPTAAQYRFMVWDAIVNGARGLNFFGGFLKGCWGASDAAAGWNWTAWSRVLPTISELRHMSGALIGHRTHLRPVRHWQRVRLTGRAHSYRVAVNTATFRVSIARVR